jgi:alpha-galactosidase
MKILFSIVFILLWVNAFTQNIEFATAKFTTENNLDFANINYDDSKWATINTTTNYENQGYDGYNGYSWYRLHFNLPTQLKNNSLWKDSLRIYLSKIDDCDEVYLNGTLISKSGSFPNQPDGYKTTWNFTQEMHLSTANPLLQWNAENVIAIKVYDGGGGGGIYGTTPYINMMDLIDGIKIENIAVENGNITCTIKNNSNQIINGNTAVSFDNTKYVYNEPIVLQPLQSKKITSNEQPTSHNFKTATVIFEEKKSYKKIEKIFNYPYILTPKPSPKPQLNTPTQYGVGINKPMLYKIPATGQQPITYQIKNLPKGLQLNANGIITGAIQKEGIYNTTIAIQNKLGKVTKSFVIKCGKGIALTPPMGWNSWNCWGTSVSDQKVRASAQAMIDKGLINYGWSFINIDDGWEAKQRTADGNILTNEKFPNMKNLGDYLHSNGLKFGIYSSPGTITCGGYLGSYNYEKQDAATYAKWGIDYLKYDWCSYENIHGGKDTTLASFKKPYIIMQKELAAQNRDMVYSLCQYGMKEVWKWGGSVGGNLWRTTGDIEDTWESLAAIGFGHTKQQPYAKPSNWNDVDMMIVGQVGWGDNLHPTKLTPDEQYTHMSLWCLLNAPLLIGCDMSKLDDFTLNLLTNNEVIAIDQNTYSLPATPIIKKDDYQVWVKKMSATEYAIGIFNTSNTDKNITINWQELIHKNNAIVRDTWQQKDEGQFKNAYSIEIPSHGVKLIMVK